MFIWNVHLFICFIIDQTVYIWNLARVFDDQPFSMYKFFPFKKIVLPNLLSCIHWQVLTLLDIAEDENIISICDALHDLVPFAQFEKREKHNGGVLPLVKLLASAWNILKLTLCHGCFHVFYIVHWDLQFSRV